MITEMPAVVEVPDRIPTGASWEGMGRRLAVWLWNRAAGMNFATVPSQLVTRPLTEEEQAARALRLAEFARRHPGGVKREAVYPMGRSSVNPYFGRRRSRYGARAQEGAR